jgi:hypothetical protein
MLYASRHSAKKGSDISNKKDTIKKEDICCSLFQGFRVPQQMAYFFLLSPTHDCWPGANPPVFSGHVCVVFRGSPSFPVSSCIGTEGVSKAPCFVRRREGDTKEQWSPLGSEIGAPDDFQNNFVLFSKFTKVRGCSVSLHDESTEVICKNRSLERGTKLVLESSSCFLRILSSMPTLKYLDVCVPDKLDNVKHNSV